MTTANYTPEDVTALIAAIDRTLGTLPALTEEQQAAAADMELALRPFRPNPEEELLDEMAAAYSNRTKQLVGYGISETHPSHREAMRDALSVVKARGIPV